jgi:hypothetical protein
LKFFILTTPFPHVYLFVNKFPWLTTSQGG